MSKDIKSFDELKDSKLLYDKNIPAFGYMIVAVITLLTIGAVIWSIFTPKIYMVAAAGTVTSENTNYVMPAVSGTISQSFLKEGLLVEEGQPLFKVESSDYNLQVQQLEESKKYYTEKLAQYQKLVKSIKDDKNYFSPAESADSFFYSNFEAYKAQVEQNKVDISSYKGYGYTDEQIEVEVKKSNAKLAEIYYNAIQAAESSADQCLLQLTSMDAQLSALKNGQDSYEIVANSSGIVHLLAEYKPGMVVQAGTAVATITPQNEDVIIEAYISPSDRVRIKNNSKVKITISGLVQSIYWTIEGEVIQIDSNATTQQGADGSSANVFKIKIKPNVTYITDGKGEKIDLTNGMAVEAKIEYDKVTYFNYVLEKLGFKVK